MFYNQLMKLCKERNIKPTPLVKTLGLSTANLRRWQNGATVNSDILAMLSEYFNVPVDYFFEDDKCRGTNGNIRRRKLYKKGL